MALTVWGPLENCRKYCFHASVYRESVSVAGGGVLVRKERKVRSQRWANRLMGI